MAILFAAITFTIALRSIASDIKNRERESRIISFDYEIDRRMTSYPSCIVGNELVEE